LQENWAFHCRLSKRKEEEQGHQEELIQEGQAKIQKASW
jgi:hypothetical protein